MCGLRERERGGTIAAISGRVRTKVSNCIFPSEEAQKESFKNLTLQTNPFIFCCFVFFFNFYPCVLLSLTRVHEHW